jgi:hypothetical protein
MDIKEYIESLSDKIWNTKNARFVAYRRMKRCEISSVIATAMSSADIIAVNMICFLNVIKDKEYFSNSIAIITTILSVMTLVLSLVVTLLRYSERKDNYHKCAISLDELNQEIKIYLTMPHNDDEMEEKAKFFVKKYNDILISSNLNHTSFDHEYAMQTGDNQCRMRKLIYWFRWNIFDINFFYWMIALVPSIITAYYIIKIVYKCSIFV